MSSISSNAPSDVYTPSTPPTSLSPSLRPFIQVTPPSARLHPAELSLSNLSSPPTPPTTPCPPITTSSSDAGETYPPTIRLFTTCQGRVQSFHQDMFTPHFHRVIGCTQPPPVTLELGMKVITGKITGTLTRVFGTEEGWALLVLQPDDQDHPYLVLRIGPQYTSLPWYWRAWLGFYRWTHWWK
jgi:hypothetical protein